MPGASPRSVWRWAWPCTCLGRELPTTGHSPDCTSFPGHKEANKLQVHIESNVQEGIFCEEGILVKVGKEAKRQTQVSGDLTSYV